ncbi:MAG: small basic protein [Fimbriiglobus sp.]
MSIDKSLRTKSGGGTNRSVIKRTERILKMMEDGKWVEGRSPFGLPKTRVQKIVLKKKKEAKAEGDAPAADDKKKK